MSRMVKEVAMYLKSYNQMGPGLRAAGDALEGFKSSATKIFMTISKAGIAAMAAIATGSVAVGASFEQSMANTSSMFITAAKDAEELAGWTDQLAAKARKMGSETAFSASEAAEAMYALASGGMSVDQVIAATDGVLMLAGATMTDLTSSAELTMRTLKMFGLEADQTNRVVNVFAAGMQNSMLNMERLDYAMKYAGPSASVLGMGVEETTAALGLLVNQLGDGSSAGTGFRMMMNKLLVPSDDLAELLDGVTVKTDGFAAVLDKLAEAEILDDPTFITEAFGAKAQGAVVALLKAGSEGLVEMTAKVTGTNAATAMYEHQMKTLNNQWKIFRSGMEETGIAIFDVIGGPLTNGIKMLQEVVAGSRGTFVLMFEYAVSGFNRIVEVVSIATTFFKEHWSTIETVGVALTVTAAAALGLAYGIQGIQIAMAIATNPVVIIVAAVAALALAYNNLTGETLTFEGAIAAAKDMLVALKPVIDSTIAAIVSGFNSAWAATQQFIGFISDNLSTIEDVGIVIGTTALAVGLYELAINASAIATKGQAAVTWVAVAATKAYNIAMATTPVGWIVAAIGILVGLIAVAIKRNGGWAKSWVKMKHVIGGWWVNVKYWMELANIAFKATGKYVGAFGDSIKLIFTASWETIRGFVSKASDALSEVGKMFSDPLSAGKHLAAAKRSISEGLLGAFDGVDKVLDSLWSNVAQGVELENEAAATALAASQEEMAKELAENLAALDQIEIDNEALSTEIIAAPVFDSSAEDFEIPSIEVEWELADKVFSEEYVSDAAGTIPAVEADIVPIMAAPDIGKDVSVAEDSIFDTLMDTSGLETFHNDIDEAYDAVADFGASAKSVMNDAWGSILDTSMTGGEKWSAIFDSLKTKAFDVLGKIVMKTLWGEKVKLKSIIFGETSATAAKAVGAATDAAMSTTKIASAGAETAANTGAAASGFFRAFSGIPFVGFAMAAAAIGLMVKMLGGLKMAGGGIVSGMGGVDNVPAMLSNKEYVMPVAQTQRYLPQLEAMRSGTYENNQGLATSGGGGGAAPMSVSVNFERGTLAVMDNDLSVDRLATKIWDVAEKGVKTLYKKD